MLKKKYVQSLNEAFARYIGVKGKAYIPKYKISCKKAIQSIKNAGGIPVLAHPIFLNLSSKNLKNFISYLKSEGLEGIEVFYPEHKAADTDYYCAGDLPAEPQYNLITTATTNSNLIMLPLTKNALATAQALANDIGAAGVVDAVSEFDAASQSWNQVTYSFVPFPPPGAWQWSGDFAISIGNGYMVNVTADTTWPTVVRNNNFNTYINNSKRK
jgi:hypothetical protein